MNELFGFVSENGIAVRRIERSGLSLEALFMEVTGR
jgi:hypothetical protein